MKFFRKVRNDFEEVNIISDDDGSLYIANAVNTIDVSRPQFIFKENSFIITGYTPLKDSFKFISWEFFKK